MKLKLILTTATVGLALALPSISNAAPAAAASASTSSISEPTLTLKRNCDFPPANYVNVIFSGFPPFTPFEGTLQLMEPASVRFSSRPMRMGTWFVQRRVRWQLRARHFHGDHRLGRRHVDGVAVRRLQ